MTTLFRLPEELRKDLATPFHPVQSEDDVVDAIHAGQYGEPIVTVGDVVSSSLLKRGIEPHLLIFDLVTQRGSIEAEHKRRLLNHPVSMTEVVSPAAELSSALVNAIKTTLNNPSPSKILVHGEEDLAGLPAIAHCPHGGTVIYGMPNQGLVAVPIDDAAKERANGFLEKMRVAAGSS